jgi:tetratricopeptide (TPR) repeat protein
VSTSFFLNPKQVLRKLPEPKSADQSWQLGFEAFDRKDQETALRMFNRVLESEDEWYVHYVIGVLNIGPISDQPPNLELGLKHLEAAATTNKPYTRATLAFALLMAEGDIERKRAFSILNDSESDHNAFEKILLGFLHEEGRVTEKNHQLAKKLWSEAAEENWIWPMQLLASRALRSGNLFAFARWKWRAVKVGVPLMKKDPDDIRLVNAT